MDNISIGIFIKKLRENKKLSQGDIAKLCNVTDQEVSKWESGVSIPDIGALQKLSILYSVTINEILDSKYNERVNLKIKANDIIMIAISILQFIVFFMPFTNNYQSYTNERIVMTGYKLVFFGIDGGQPASAQTLLGILIIVFMYIVLVAARLLNKNSVFHFSIIGLSVLSIVMLLMIMMQFSYFVLGTVVIYIILSIGMIILHSIELKKMKLDEETEQINYFSRKGIVGISSLLYGIFLIPFIASFEYSNFEWEFAMVFALALVIIIAVYVFAKEKFYENILNPITLLSLSPITFFGVSLYYYIQVPYETFPTEILILFTLTLSPIVLMIITRAKQEKLIDIKKDISGS